MASVLKERRLQIAVIGSAECGKETASLAYEVGRLIAERGAVLVCGGLGGVMLHAACGAKEAGGTTVGILPGESKEDANPYIDIKIPTAFGEGRNVLVVRSADVVIAIEGGMGTLSEIALALRMKIPVVGLNTWSLKREGEEWGVVNASSPAEAVQKAFSLCRR